MNNNDIQWTAEEKLINRKVKTLMENERDGETDKIRAGIRQTIIDSANRAKQDSQNNMAVL